MTDKLTPNYVDADFSTMKERLRTLLSKTDTFKDYNFEGANISILMELCAYVGDLNTYFTNKLAQNIHTETANVYEVVHSLVRQQGHEPSGYIASELLMKVTIDREDDNGVVYFEDGDQLYVPQWFQMPTGLFTTKGEAIFYTLAYPFTYTVTENDIANGYVTFDLIFRQGIAPTAPIRFTGEDIVSNQIVLPFKHYDMGSYPYEDTQSSMYVVVGDTEEMWTRSSDFYDDISGLSEIDKAYMLNYDKYGRYVLAFSLTREIPTIDQKIDVYLLETLGLSGRVSARTFDTANNVGSKPNTSNIMGENNVPFLTNISQADQSGYNGYRIIPVAQYDVINENPSSGGADPQVLDELKEAGKASAHSQHRNTTRKDYIGVLEKRADITKANAWGEHEQSPGVLRPTNYNKAYISLVPTEWDNGGDSNVFLEPSSVTGEFVNDLTGKTLEFPTGYNSVWTKEILEYVEPRKVLGVWEEFVLPELVYFRVDLGLKIKRAYSFVDVRDSVRRKLEYYFQSTNRQFGDIIDFREIHNYIIDPSNVSSDDDFFNVRGIYSLVIRDVKTYRNTVETISNEDDCDQLGGTWSGTCSIVPNNLYIYPDNMLNYFPHYIDTGYEKGDDSYNALTPIQLGYNQFPRLASEYCIYVNEG